MFLFTVSYNSPVDEQVFVGIRYITNKCGTIIGEFQKKIFGLYDKSYIVFQLKNRLHLSIHTINLDIINAKTPRPHS